MQVLVQEYTEHTGLGDSKVSQVIPPQTSVLKVMAAIKRQTQGKN